MMESMKDATKLLGSMNRQMNLPALQRIAMEFERENDVMDQRQEMMDDAIDEVTGEDEEEGEDVVNQVLDEIGVDLNQSASLTVVLDEIGTDVFSLEKRPLDYRRPRWQMAKLRKPLGAILETTIFRRDWIVCGGSVGGCHFSRPYIDMISYCVELWRLTAMRTSLRAAFTVLCDWRQA